MTFLQLEHFVSMVIVHMGIFARLYSITHKWINELKECYHLVYLWYQITPNGTKSIESTKSYTLTTFDNEREIANQWNENRISYKNPIHFESYLVNSSTFTNLNESLKSTSNENTPNDNKSKNSNNTYLFDINIDNSNDYSCDDDDVDLGGKINRNRNNYNNNFINIFIRYINIYRNYQSLLVNCHHI